MLEPRYSQNPVLKFIKNFSKCCLINSNYVELPVKTIQFLGLFPHNSMNWTTSPNRNDGCPQNTTQG